MTKRAFLKRGEALMLRTCDADGKSYGGFQWPKKGAVLCDDWKRAASCGNGLHGLLCGMGNGSLLNWDAEAKWLVVRVKLSAVVKIDSDKVKVPRGEVVYYGDRLHATELIAKYAPSGSTIVGFIATAGYGGTLCIRYWNGERYKLACFAVGENDIKPNKPYRVNEKGEPVKAEGRQ